MAKKKSFRSGPTIVSDNDRCILLIRLVYGICFSLQDTGVSGAGKKPRQEVHCRDGHSDAEEYAGEDSLRAAFTESEGQTGDHDGDQREAASDGGCERLHQNVDSVLPR